MKGKHLEDDDGHNKCRGDPAERHEKEEATADNPDALYLWEVSVIQAEHQDSTLTQPTAKQRTPGC